MKVKHQFPMYTNNCIHYYVFIAPKSNDLYVDWTVQRYTTSPAVIAYDINLYFNEFLVRKRFDDTFDIKQFENIATYQTFVTLYQLAQINIYEATDNTYRFGQKLSATQVYELWLKHRYAKITSINNRHVKEYPRCHRTWQMKSSGVRIVKRQNFQNTWRKSILPVRHRNRKVICKYDEDIIRNSTGWKTHKQKHQWG